MRTESVTRRTKTPSKPEKPAQERPSERRSNAQRRHDSRAALIEAALDLVTEGESFETLSLRKVSSRAGLVASAFYRYFESMEALGISIVEESFLRLRQVLRHSSVANGLLGPRPITNAVELLSDFIREEHRHLTFVARQRVAGSPQVRRLIRSEIGAMGSQVAFLIARYEPISSWPITDTEMLAGMIINVLMQAIDRSLGALDPNGSSDEQDAFDTISSQTSGQLTYLLVASRNWRPRPVGDIAAAGSKAKEE